VAGLDSGIQSPALKGSTCCLGSGVLFFPLPISLLTLSVFYNVLSVLARVEMRARSWRDCRNKGSTCLIFFILKSIGGRRGLPRLSQISNFLAAGPRSTTSMRFEMPRLGPSMFLLAKFSMSAICVHVRGRPIHHVLQRSIRTHYRQSQPGATGSQFACSAE